MLHDAAAPTNTSEVHNLLGMANYIACFIKNFAIITQPLRVLVGPGWKSTRGFLIN